MSRALTIAVLVTVLAVLAVVGGAVYVVYEYHQVIITRFGEPVGDPVTTPGLHLKMPFIDKANYFEKRFLEWNGAPNQIPTKDKRFIYVDTYARWRITDPLLFFQRLRDELQAQSRIDDILDGETRNTVARHNLIEVVRTTNREFALAVDLEAGETTEVAAKIESGRSVLARQVLEAASARSADLGIEILDFRFKRIEYVEEVQQEVYARMVSERKRIAEQFRSEGAGEAARINGERDRQLKTITSEAYREAQEIKGKADAEAADIYAAAYNRDPEFYRFQKSMETFRQVIDEDTLLVLTTDGDLLQFLQRAQ
jgi:membrane protease subunit HflC